MTPKAEADNPTKTPGGEALLVAIARGDPQAPTRALEVYGGLVWKIARTYLKRREDAEDASQEVFISLCRTAHRFDPTRGSEAAFVAAVARSRVIDLARRLRARPDIGAAGTGGDEALDQRAHDSGGPYTGGQRDPERGQEFAEDARRAKEALAALSPEQQEVIRLTVHRGYTHEGVAKVLGIPAGTAKTRIRTALTRLRDVLRAPASGHTPALARGEVA